MLDNAYIVGMESRFGVLHVDKDVDMSRKDFIAGYMAAMAGTGKMAWNSPKEIPAVAEDFIDHCESIGNPVSDASEIYEFAHFLEQRYASRKKGDRLDDMLNENKSSDYYQIYWLDDEAHMSDGEHSVFIGYASDGLDLIDRLPMCEDALDNWQE